MIPTRTRLWRWLLCKVGVHGWCFGAYVMKHGGRFGDRCEYCKQWKDDSVIWSEDEKETTG